MTYRLVPYSALRTVQFMSLIVTALVGLSIWATPKNLDAKLSVIEQAMNADWWAWGLTGFSVIALVCEIDMAIRKHYRWVGIVSACHILLAGLLIGYSAAALWGVLFRVWWNFGAPCMGALLTVLHFVFVRREPPGGQSP